MTDRNEHTSKAVASLASQLLAMDDGQIRQLALEDDGPMVIRALAASALTQTADKRDTSH